MVALNVLSKIRLVELLLQSKVAYMRAGVNS